MILHDLMKLEEKLLMLELSLKFEMSFSDYITLNNFLNETEKITNLYFQLIGEYKKHLNEIKNADNNELIEKLKEYNNKLLNEEVYFEFKPYEEFIMKYNLIN